jgi:hypothetical protein
MIATRPSSSEPPRRGFRVGRALGGAALSIWVLCLGVHYLQSPAAPQHEPFVRPSIPGEKQPQGRGPVARAGYSEHADGSESRELPSVEKPGPKFAEERQPLEGTSSRSTDQDPGPGPHLAFYGGRSGRLSPNASAHSSSEPVKNVSKGKGPKLMVWAASTRVTLGQPATIRAILADDSGHLLKPDSISIAIGLADHVSADSASSMPAAPPGDQSQFVFTYVPGSSTAAGSNADSHTASTRERTADNHAAAAPGSTADNHAAAAPGPNADSHAAPPQEYEFIVRATGSADGAAYEKVTGGFFLVQNSGARLDRESAAVDLVRGNLELSVGVHVERAGSYLASAELWGADADQPIAFARERLDALPAGDQRATLLFGGRVIRDSSVNGPYVVRNVRLLQIDSLPPHFSDPIDELPKTRDYRTSDFY